MRDAPNTEATGADQVWPDVLPRHEWVSVLLSAGVWLVFLVWPLVAMVTGEAGPGLTLLGVLGLVLFVVTYLLAFIVPRPLRALPRWVSTLGFTAVLASAAALMVPAAGPPTVNTLPFFVALWLFAHSLRTGLIATLCITVIVGITAWSLLPLTVFPTLIGAFGLILVVLVSIRFSVEREESARVMAEELALARQRESLARDVHDVLGHSLTVVTVKAQLAHRLVETDPERAKVEIDDLLELSRRSLAEVRSTVTRLRTPELSGQLAATRTALEAAGITADLPGPGTVAEIPAGQQELFAWCLREAVTNVVRHSQASRCWVRLSPGRLVVVDDGVGPGAAPDTGDGGAPQRSAGSGLAGMRHRVGEFGGTLTVRTGQDGARRSGGAHSDAAHSDAAHSDGVRPDDARPGTHLEVTL